MSEQDKTTEETGAAEAAEVEATETEEVLSLSEGLSKAIKGEKLDGEPDPEPDAKAEGEGEAEPAEAAGDGEDGKTAPPDGASELTIPDNFPADRRDALVKMPADAQKQVLEIFDEIQAAGARSAQEQGEQVKLASEMGQVFEPWQGYLQQQGLSAPQATERLLGLYRHYLSDPKGYIQQVAKLAGIDLAALGEPGESDDYEPLDPRVVTLQQRLDKTEQALNQFQTGTQQREVAQAQSVIQQFAEAKDAEGNPTHPHYEQVKARMAKLFGSGEADSLDQAYELAVRLDPTLYTAEIERVRQETLAEAKKRQEEEVARAKTGRTITTKSAPTEVSTKGMKLGDVIDKAISHHV